MGHKVEIVYDPILRSKSDNVGECHYRFGEIHLQADVPGVPRREDLMLHTFWHELVHYVLYYAGYMYNPGKDESLHNNEGLVDVMAGLLHQAFETFEYD